MPDVQGCVFDDIGAVEMFATETYVVSQGREGNRLTITKKISGVIFKNKNEKLKPWNFMR